MNIKVGDRVRVLYGSEKGKHGVISRIVREKNQATCKLATGALPGLSVDVRKPVQVVVSGVSLKRS